MSRPAQLARLVCRCCRYRPAGAYCTRLQCHGHGSAGHCSAQYLAAAHSIVHACTTIAGAEMTVHLLFCTYTGQSTRNNSSALMLLVGPSVLYKLKVLLPEVPNKSLFWGTRSNLE